MNTRKISITVLFFFITFMFFNQNINYINADGEFKDDQQNNYNPIKNDNYQENKFNQKKVIDNGNKKDNDLNNDKHEFTSDNKQLGNKKEQKDTKMNNVDSKDNVKISNLIKIKNKQSDKDNQNKVMNSPSRDLSSLSGLTDWTNWRDFNQHDTLGFHDLSDENSTKGSTSISGYNGRYNNNINVDYLGQENNNNYIDLTYGSPGDNGGQYRYVQFQMRLSEEMLQLVDKDKSTVEYSPSNGIIPSNGKQNLNHYFTSGKNIIYNYIFDCNNFHSGQIKIHLVLKNQIDMNVDNQLLDMYYKSDTSRKDLFNKQNNDYIRFETIQTLHYDDIKNYVNGIIDTKYNDMRTKVWQSNNLTNDEKVYLLKNIDNQYNITQDEFKSYNLRQLNRIINTLSKSIDQFNSINFFALRDTGLSNISFKDTQTNDGNSSVLVSPKFSIGSFNINHLQISLKFSNLVNQENNNYQLKNLKFVSGGQVYDPNTPINYLNIDNPDNSNGQFSNDKEFQMHFSQHTSPSGNYKGDAIWTISNEVPMDNGINQNK